MKHLLATQIGRLRILALLEGVSFLLILFVTMPLKYLLDMRGPNLVIGMAHGVLFILYIYYVLEVRSARKWPARTTLQALAASVIPFGTFWADKHIFRKEEPSADLNKAE